MAWHGMAWYTSREIIYFFQEIFLHEQITSWIEYNYNSAKKTTSQCLRNYSIPDRNIVNDFEKASINQSLWMTKLAF